MTADAWVVSSGRLGRMMDGALPPHIPGVRRSTACPHFLTFPNRKGLGSCTTPISPVSLSLTRSYSSKMQIFQAHDRHYSIIFAEHVKASSLFQFLGLKQHLGPVWGIQGGGCCLCGQEGARSTHISSRASGPLT